jgi:hypothetical protein
LAEARERLWIDRLLSHAATADSLAGPNAQRMLETTFVQTSFYEPRRYFEQGDPARALAVLEVAHAIKPTDGWACYGLAQAHAALGHPADAVEALECVVGDWDVDAEWLERDRNLAALAGTAEFDRLLAELRERRN